MPAPLVVGAAAVAARLLARKLAKDSAKKVVKATVKKKVVSRSRQAFDIPVAGSSAKQLSPKMGKRNLDISENVAIKNAKSPSGKVSIRGGVAQVMNQNVRSAIKPNKVEAKANARGLKAANKPNKKMENVPAGVSARFAETNARLAKETLRKKAVPAVRKTSSGRVINDRAKKAQMPKKSK
jgi:hypothetical protein